jgi:hypothetical protein
MSHVYERAATKILDWLHVAERELVGTVVATFNGETGAIKGLALDDFHGLCFTFDDEVDAFTAMELGRSRRFYPVSTIKQVAL